MDKKSLERVLMAIGGLIVAGTLFWLFTMGGWKVVMELLFGPRATIETGSLKECYRSDEAVLFSLQNVQSDRVFWVFDRVDVSLGNVQTEHAFQFDKSKPKGMILHYRVEAVYEYKDKLHYVSRFCCVENIPHEARQAIEEPGVTLSSETILDDQWRLSTVSLGKVEDGRFKQVSDLPLEKSPDGSIVTSFIPRETIIPAFGYPEDVDLKTELATPGDAWVIYDYMALDGEERLSIVEPLSIFPP